MFGNLGFALSPGEAEEGKGLRGKLVPLPALSQREREPEGTKELGIGYDRSWMIVVVGGVNDFEFYC